ncbi:MAG TPA: MATE family efflux transporter [Opitutaceae bacterium]|jgi:putative MATE family efflux protein|nr:MATE family efflux transporter [Opitutaceae bacterium]
MLRTENLFRLTWPIYVQQMTQSFVLLADFWFFSRLSDTIAATIGQLMPIVWMGAFVIPVFAGTGVAVATQFMGAKRFDRVVPTYQTNLCLTVAMGAVFALLMRLLASDVGPWMGMNARESAIGTAYLGTFAAYFVFVGILVGYNAVLSSRGLTHWLMYSSAVVATLNVALAATFVLAFHWGVRGIALASVISVAAAAALSAWLVHGPLGIRFHRRNAWRDMAEVLPPVLRIGVANAMEPFSYAAQQTILSTLIVALGVKAMAANNYASRPQVFQIIFSVSLALAAQILMGHWTGAKRFADVDRLYWTAIRRACFVAAVYALTLWFFSDPVLGFFTHDPAIKHLGKTLLLIAAFYEPARAVNIITGNALKTVGDAHFPMIVAVVFIWGIVPVVLYIDHRWHLSLAGFWICFAADEIIRSLINLWRWRTGRWKSMGIVHHLPVPVFGGGEV